MPPTGDAATYWGVLTEPMEQIRARRSPLVLLIAVLLVALTVPLGSTRIPGRDATAWAAASITQARVEPGASSRELVISFGGGPEFQAGYPCSVEYRARVKESGSRVEILIEGRHAMSDGTNYGCPDLAYSRSVTASLFWPLSGRPVVVR